MSGQQFGWSCLFGEWNATAYGLIFLGNLHMCLSVSYPSGFIGSHLRTEQTLISLKGRVLVLCCFISLRHQDLRRGKRNWNDYFHTRVLLHGLCFSALLDLLQLHCFFHVCRNIYILENHLYDDKWTSTGRRQLSYVCISKRRGSVTMDLYAVIAGAQSLVATPLPSLWVYFRLALVRSYQLNNWELSECIRHPDWIFQFNFSPADALWECCTMWTEQRSNGFKLKVHIWSALLIWTRKN